MPRSGSRCCWDCIPANSLTKMGSTMITENIPRAEATAGALNASAVSGPAASPSRLHVDARGAALAIIATVAFVFALQWAQKFLVPVVFGIFIAYTLNPVVACLQRLKMPRVVATCVVLSAILCGGAVVTNALRGEFQSILEQLPEASHKLSRGLAKLRDGQP